MNQKYLNIMLIILTLLVLFSTILSCSLQLQIFKLQDEIDRKFNQKHESFHTGHTEILRQAAGKDDKIR